MCFYGESEAVLMSTHIYLFIYFFFFFLVFLRINTNCFLKASIIFKYLNYSSVGCPNYLGFYGFDFLGQFTVKILKI